MSNAETVQQIYEAFGRGDIAALLDHVADDVEWDVGGNRDVPWLHPRHGKAEVPHFFEALGQLQFVRFEPHTILASGDTVVSLVNVEAIVRATGAPIIEEDEAHIWRFRDGKIVRFRHRVDTWQHLQAIRAPVVTP